MPTIHFQLCFGLSLFWEYCCIFNQFSDIQYKIALSKEFVVSLRSESYYNSMKEILLNQIKPFKNVTFTEDTNVIGYTPEELYQNSIGMSTKIDRILMYDPPSRKIKNLYGNYIVLNTKIILGSYLHVWSDNKDFLLEKINNSDIKVMVIGEKNPMKCKEYDIHGAPSIYEEIKNGFQNVIDLTVDNTEVLYDYKIMKRNINLLKNSKFNIHFGDGGGRVVYLFLNNLICLCDNFLFPLRHWDNRYKCVQTTNSEVFKGSLEEFLKL